MFKIIPAIDLLGSEVVRLSQGDYAQVQRYTQSAADWAKYFEDQGATRIHLVDLDAAKSGSFANLPTIESIRQACSCELELGGGIRDLASAKRLDNLGINYFILGSLLVKNWEESEAIIHTFPDRIIAGLDLKNESIAIHGWIQSSDFPLQHMIDRCNQVPIESVIITDVAKDGMMQGPNLDLLKRLSALIKKPLIASGGVSCEEDIQSLCDLETVSGCIIGKALLSGALEISNFLR